MQNIFYNAGTTFYMYFYYASKDREKKVCRNNSLRTNLGENLAIGILIV